MIELAEVFRRFAAGYLSVYGASMLPSHRRAIEDILACRTATLGGQVWRCQACNTDVFSYHSCGNRSCPKCHTEQTQEWLERRQAELLPVPYFHIIITVPAELRAVLRTNQRDGYGLLMQACAAAIIELASDPRYVGDTVAVLAVLHTWTQQLNLHPHVHCLVSGGGISGDASSWHPARRKFLLPIKALAKLVGGKFRALLHRKRPDLVIPDAAWRTPWILHVTAWGSGEQAVLDYLARYVFRVALTNARIVDLDDRTVTLQYKERKSGRRRTCRLSGEEFMRRFLQHVLPRGFHKVRYFGLWHPAQRHNAARVRQMLQLQAPPEPSPPPELVLPSREPSDAEPMSVVEPWICPHCHHGQLTFIRTLQRNTPRQAMAP
jgi:Putative transposase/Transposase zinc-binding domain